MASIMSAEPGNVNKIIEKIKQNEQLEENLNKKSTDILTETSRLRDENARLYDLVEEKQIEGEILQACVAAKKGELGFRIMEEQLMNQFAQKWRTLNEEKEAELAHKVEEVWTERRAYIKSIRTKIDDIKSDIATPGDMAHLQELLLGTLGTSQAEAESNQEAETSQAESEFATDQIEEEMMDFETAELLDSLDAVEYSQANPPRGSSSSGSSVAQNWQGGQAAATQSGGNTWHPNCQQSVARDNRSVAKPQQNQVTARPNSRPPPQPFSTQQPRRFPRPPSASKPQLDSNPSRDIAPQPSTNNQRRIDGSSPQALMYNPKPSSDINPKTSTSNQKKFGSTPQPSVFNSKPSSEINPKTSTSNQKQFGSTPQPSVYNPAFGSASPRPELFNPKRAFASARSVLGERQATKRPDQSRGFQPISSNHNPALRQQTSAGHRVATSSSGGPTTTDQSATYKPPGHQTFGSSTQSTFRASAHDAQKYEDSTGDYGQGDENSAGIYGQTADNSAGDYGQGDDNFDGNYGQGDENSDGNYGQSINNTKSINYGHGSGNYGQRSEKPTESYSRTTSTQSTGPSSKYGRSENSPSFGQSSLQSTTPVPPQNNKPTKNYAIFNSSFENHENSLKQNHKFDISSNSAFQTPSEIREEHSSNVKSCFNPSAEYCGVQSSSHNLPQMSQKPPHAGRSGERHETKPAGRSFVPKKPITRPS